MAGVDIDDLPQTWERPGYEALVAALQSLELRPPIWNHRRKRADIVAEQESMASQRRAEAARYLSSIIRSPLAWLDDDGEREEVWELASRRMTERCGRMAMGEVLRSWPFDCDGSGVSSFEPFEVVIKEPAMTGDSLGLKTWGSSYVLAQHLPRLGATSLFRLFDESFGEPRPDVLELGSGTGLLGLAAAAVWKVPVVLSDLPNIVPNLKENADKNASLVEARGGSATVGRLTWGGIGEDEVDGELFGKPNQFKIVLAADPLYDDNHPALLASAISQHLSLERESRAVVMVPLRDETTRRLLGDFRRSMLALVTPMDCDEEAQLAGQDDWAQGGEDGEGVKCWLGIFSRRENFDGGGKAGQDD